MNNDIDNKKIFQMVLVIGVLCLFVGIATRIRQGSLVTLSDLPKSTLTDVAKDSDDTNSAENTKVSSATTTTADNKKTSEDKHITKDEYDNFYYTTENDTASLHIMYYDSNHKLTTAELSCSEDKAEELLQLYFDLYKGGHDFQNINELNKYCE